MFENVFFFFFIRLLILINLTRDLGPFKLECIDLFFEHLTQMMEIFVGRVLVSGVFLLLEQQLKHVFPRTKPTTVLRQFQRMLHRAQMSYFKHLVSRRYFAIRTETTTRYARIRELEISSRVFPTRRKLSPLSFCARLRYLIPSIEVDRRF